MMVDSDRERPPWLPLADFLLMEEKGTRIENELLPLYILMAEDNERMERLGKKIKRSRCGERLWAAGR